MQEPAPKGKLRVHVLQGLKAFLRLCVFSEDLQQLFKHFTDMITNEISPNGQLNRLGITPHETKVTSSNLLLTYKIRMLDNGFKCIYRRNKVSFMIGGSQIYLIFLPAIDQIYLNFHIQYATSVYNLFQKIVKRGTCFQLTTINSKPQLYHQIRPSTEANISKRWQFL